MWSSRLRARPPGSALRLQLLMVVSRFVSAGRHRSRRRVELPELFQEETVCPCQPVLLVESTDSTAASMKDRKSTVHGLVRWKCLRDVWVE